MDEKPHNSPANLFDLKTVGGRPYIFLGRPKGSPDLLTGAYAREISLKDEETPVRLDLNYTDIAFLVNSLADYLHDDAEIILRMKGFTIFVVDGFKDKFVADMRAAAQRLSATADMLTRLPVAKVSE